MAQDQKTLLRDKLKKIGREAEERAAKRKAEKFGLPFLDLSHAPINIEVLGMIPKESAEKAQSALIEAKNQQALLLVFNPDQPEMKELIKGLEEQNFKVKLAIGSLTSLRHIWEFYQYVLPPAKEITGKVQIDPVRLDELTKKLITLQLVKEEIANFKNPFTSLLLEIIFAGAFANRASDIHLESIKGGGRLRFRVDGLLHDVVESFGAPTYHSLVSRVKLLSGLKLNVHNQAQDGRFTIGAGDKDIEMRTSVIPAEFGETIVLRILDPSAIRLNLSDLGLRPDDLEIIEEQLAQPNGLILNTGPTGSGKTTTLYAFLNHVYDPEVKIITIEDPVEYHLAGIQQTQVHSESGYTFSSGLRSILRQDPDIILVGEIRDLATVEIAMQASLTGHLVFSTLHTNDAAGAVPRLINLGVKPSTIAPATNLVIAQRLTRRLCENCKQEVKMNDDLAGKIKRFLDGLPARVDREPFKNYKIFEPKNCEKCGGVGYKGRVGIYELFVVTPEIEELIVKDPTETEMFKIAKSQGMVTLQEDGIMRTLKGQSSFAEVERNTGPIKWP